MLGVTNSNCYARQKYDCTPGYLTLSEYPAFPLCILPALINRQKQETADVPLQKRNTKCWSNSVVDSTSGEYR